MKTGLVLSLFALFASAALSQVGSQQPARSKKRAIVIGVESYKLLPNLSFSIDDARAFSDLLVEHMGFDRQDIVLLTDGRDQSTRPTRENVFGAIDSLASNPTAVPSDLFVLYFSGHGVARDGQDYLLPSDVGSSEAKEKGVSLQSVVARLAQLDITNVLIVADACRTGESGEFGLSIRELCSELNIGLLLSCKPGARAYESSLLGHGIFTKAIIETFDQKSDYVDETGSLWLSDLAAGIEENAAKLAATYLPSREQVPQSYLDDVFDLLIDFNVSALDDSEMDGRIDDLPAAQAAAVALEIGLRIYPNDREAAYKWFRTGYMREPDNPRAALMFARSALDFELDSTSRRVANRFRNSERHDIYTLTHKLTAGAEGDQSQLLGGFFAAMGSFPAISSDHEAMLAVHVAMSLVDTVLVDESELIALESAFQKLQESHNWIRIYWDLAFIEARVGRVDFATAEPLLSKLYGLTSTALVRTEAVLHVGIQLMRRRDWTSFGELIESDYSRALPESHLLLWKLIHKQGVVQAADYLDVEEWAGNALIPMLPERLTAIAVSKILKNFRVCTEEFLSEVESRFSPQDPTLFERLVLTNLALTKTINALWSGASTDDAEWQRIRSTIDEELLDLEKIEVAAHSFRVMRDVDAMVLLLFNARGEAFAERAGFANYLEFARGPGAHYWQKVAEMWSPLLGMLSRSVGDWQDYMSSSVRTGNTAIALAAAMRFNGARAIEGIFTTGVPHRGSSVEDTFWKLVITSEENWRELLGELPGCKMPLALSAYHRSGLVPMWVNDWQFLYKVDVDSTGTFVFTEFDSYSLHFDPALRGWMEVLFTLGAFLVNYDREQLDAVAQGTDPLFSRYRSVLEKAVVEEHGIFDPVGLLVLGYAIGESGSADMAAIVEALDTLPYTQSSYLYPSALEYWLRQEGVIESTPAAKLLDYHLLSNSMASIGPFGEYTVFARGLAGFAGEWSEEVEVEGLSGEGFATGTLEWSCDAEGELNGTLLLADKRWMLYGTLNEVGTVQGFLISESPEDREKYGTLTAFFRMPPNDEAAPDKIRGLPVVINFVSNQGVGKITAKRLMDEIRRSGAGSVPR
ncbi:MAG: caspase family protein [Armatimonadetes bacterium]|nr:caspase family protein [Armatimonadota bacterium]